MNVQVLIAIAQLCTVSAGRGDAPYVLEAQLKCQQQYIKCVQSKSVRKGQHLPEWEETRMLTECILEHK